MTRNSKELLVLALGLGLAACQSKGGTLAPTVTIVSPTDGATLTADAGTVAACVLTTTVTAQTTGIANGAFGNLTVNGVAAGTSQVASGTLTFTNVPLDGSTSGTKDVLVVTIDGVTATATVTVMLNCGGTTCADAGMPTLAFTVPTPNQVFTLGNSGGSPPLQITFHLITNVTSGSIEVCSTIASPSSTTACNFGTGLFEVGTATVSSNGANGGSASLTKPVGDDGMAANQTISAQLTSACGDASASVPIQAHAVQPVIASVVVENTSDAGSDGCQYWLNSYNLNDAGAASATVVVTAEAGDTFGDGGAVLTFTGTADLMDSAALSGASSPSAQIPIVLSNGAYSVSATVIDVWGNESLPDQFQICVKTTLPSCTLSDSYANGCFNIVDNGGMASNGEVPVTLTVSASNASANDVNGVPIDGATLVTTNGGTGPTAGTLSASCAVPSPTCTSVAIAVSSDQGADVYTATVTDPAGNPAAVCTPASLDLTVSTEGPALTVTVPSAGNGADANGCEIYKTRDGIPVNLTTPDIANGGLVTFEVTGANGGSSANYQTTVASGAASAMVSAVPNGIDTVTVKGKDACGNPGTGTACIDVQVLASDCDLSFVSPIPTVTGSNELLLFNASEVVGGMAGIEFHTSCAAGTQVLFSSTPLDGSAQPQTAGVDANGNVTFNLSSLVDGSNGTFTASIAGGESLPAILYYVKLSLPAFTSETPAAGALEVVAAQGNLILDDAGVSELAFDGGTIIAAAAQCTANFTITGMSGLGPVDGSGNIGTAILTLNFPGLTTTNPNPIDIAAGSTSVTFSAVTLPAVSYPGSGTVTVALSDNAGNTTSETWDVTTDCLQPPTPAFTAAMSDKRTAAVKLSWTVPAGNGDSAIQGYELTYQINPLNVMPPAIPNAVTYPQGWTLDPGIAVLDGAAGPNLTYTESNLPTLNQYTFELRSIDAVGNLSPLAATATAVSVSAADANAWQSVVITDTANDAVDSDFGYVLRSGDFDNNGMQDLVITAPYQYAANPTPGVVYVLSGAANLSKVTFANLNPITLGGTDFDWFGQDAHVAKFANTKFDDLVVGSPEYKNGQGRIDIFFGSATGLPSAPSTTILGDGTQSSLFGYSVSSADVDGDGIPDLLVGAPGAGASGNGAYYVFLAKNGWPNPDAGADISSATSVITGNAGDGVGARWGSVDMGDINADGDEDFTVSAPGGGGTDGFDAGTGTVYGFSGATAVANATMTVAANALFTLMPDHVPAFCDPQNFGYASGGGSEAFTFWGCFGTNAIGDVSFTGGKLPDLVVSSDYYSAVYLYTMAKNGPNNVANAPELQDQSGALGWSMVAPDLNLDGHPDLLVGENYLGTPYVMLYLNNGTGLPATQSGELFGANAFGYGLAAADFQGIAKPDFAVSDWESFDVTVYY